jgi:TnpA family transposase
MARREVLSPSQRLRLAELPVDLDERLIARHHTLSEDDLAVVRRRRGSSNRLGFATLLALLRFPGRPLRPSERAPEKIVRYVASQIGEDPKMMDSYAGRRESTRREHLSEISSAFGFRPFDEEERKELRAWLSGVAAMTDSGYRWRMGKIQRS